MMKHLFNEDGLPAEIRVFFNHVYEYKKGVRPMVLYTLNKAYEPFVTHRLHKQSICYHVQEVSSTKVNLFFGDEACIRVVESIIHCPLNELTPEQDFILGALLDYSLKEQCKRYCVKRSHLQCTSSFI